MASVTVFFVWLVVELTKTRSGDADDNVDCWCLQYLSAGASESTYPVQGSRAPTSWPAATSIGRCCLQSARACTD